MLAGFRGEALVIGARALGGGGFGTTRTGLALAEGDGAELADDTACARATDTPATTQINAKRSCLTPV